MLLPQGPRAEATAELAWLLFGGGTLIFVAVMVAVLLAVSRSARARRFLSRDSTVIVAGAGLPIVTLSLLLAHALRIEADLETEVRTALTIDVRGEQWWWRVLYRDAEGGFDFPTANEIRIPIGVPVELRLESADVIHSFWVPALAGKLDMIPGRVNRLELHAERPGVFRGQCAEYCGGAHAAMAFHVVAEPQADFEAWRERQRQPAAEPAGDEARRGRDVFLETGCGLCHRVAGTDALGTVGPDLTHVGGRLHHVSGLFRTHPGTFAGWIASAQRIKPGNRMPSFESIPGADLRALATWLANLE